MKRPEFVCLAALTALGACKVGPDYVVPEVETPDAFHDSEPVSVDAAEIAEWWTVFGDEQMSSLIDRVLDENLDMAAAVQRIEASRAGFRAATGARYPNVEVNGSVQEIKVRGFDSSTDAQTLGASAAWELDVFGRVRRSVEAAAADMDAAVEDARAVRVALAAETAATYLLLRSIQARLAIAVRNVDGQQNSLEIAQLRFNAGMAAALDPAQAEVNLATTESALPALQLAGRQAMHRLAVLTGSDPRELVSELVDPQPMPGVPAELLVGLPADLLRNRPDVRAAERRLAAQTARIGVAEAVRYPSFNLTGSWDVLDGGASALFDPNREAWSIGLPVSLPIFTGGRLSAQVDAEEARAREFELAYFQSVLIAQEEVENALVAFANDRRQAEVLTRAVEAARRSAFLSRELYTSGQSAFQNVLDAERSQFELEGELEQVRLDILLDLVDLYRAIGGGWADAEQETP